MRVLGPAGTCEPVPRRGKSDHARMTTRCAQDMPACRQACCAKTLVARRQQTTMVRAGPRAGSRVIAAAARVSGSKPGLWSRASDEALRENKLEQAAAADGRRPGGSLHTAVRVRDSLVVVLALTSGAIDAVTFVRLGNVFSSVITGNLALLGLAVGEHHSALAVSSGLALAAYAVGVLAGGALAGPIEGGQPVWPRRTTM